MIGRTALERLAVDLADERKTDAVAIGDNGIVALVFVRTVLLEELLDFLVDFLVGHFNDRLFELDGLEVHQRNRGKHFIGNRKRQIAFTIQHAVDERLIFAEVDFGLRCSLFRTLFERLGNGLVDRILQHFAHQRTAIDLFEMRGRHFAGAEALDLHLAPNLVELFVEFRCERRRRNGHIELAAQPFVQSFSYVHFAYRSRIVVNRVGSRRRIWCG